MLYDTNTLKKKKTNQNPKRKEKKKEKRNTRNDPSMQIYPDKS